MLFLRKSLTRLIWSCQILSGADCIFSTNRNIVTMSLKFYAKKDFPNEPGKKIKLLGDKTELMSVISVDGNVMMGVKTRSEAEVLAHKSNSILVKVEDSEYGIKKYPIYKLVNRAKIASERDDKSKEMGKTERTMKMISIGSKISSNDLDVKARTIKRWTDKKYEVKVVLTGVNQGQEKPEKIYEQLESQLGTEVRFLQKSIKNGNIKFTVMAFSEKKSKEITKKNEEKKEITETDNS